MVFTVALQKEVLLPKGTSLYNFRPMRGQYIFTMIRKVIQEIIFKNIPALTVSEIL